MYVPFEDDGASGYIHGPQSESRFSIHEEGTLTRATGGEDDSTNFGNSLGTNCTNLDDDLWVIDIVELGPRTGNNGPRFTKDLDSGWDLQGIGYEVRPRIKEDDPTSGELRRNHTQRPGLKHGISDTDLVENSLKRSRIIALTVALGSLSLYADNLAGVVAGIGGSSLAENAAVLEQALLLRNRRCFTLQVAPRRAGSVCIPLDPSVDSDLACRTSKNRLPTDDPDDSWNVGGHDIVEDDRGLKLSSRLGTSVENGGVPHNRVNDGNRTGTLAAIIHFGANLDLESNLCIVDGNPLEVPPPIPGHLHTGVGAIDCDISHGKLLVSDVQSHVSPVNDEVSHKTATK